MNKRPPFVKKRKHSINSEIVFPKVRVVGDGLKGDIMDTNDAIEMALSMDKDLILITENGNPPVVKIEDYNKFLYQQEKMEKERKRNSSKVDLREIQLSCNIADNDINTKSKKSRVFLEDGDKVKCVIQLKGRQKAMPEQGELVMLKFADILSDIGSPESMPKLDGSRWIMILKPKK